MRDHLDQAGPSSPSLPHISTPPSPTQRFHCGASASAFFLSSRRDQPSSLAGSFSSTMTYFSKKKRRAMLQRLEHLDPPRPIPGPSTSCLQQYQSRMAGFFFFPHTLLISPLVLVRYARQGWQFFCFFPHSSHQPTCSGAECPSRMAGYVFFHTLLISPLVLVRYARRGWQVMFLSTLFSSAHLFWCGMPVKDGRLCFFHTPLISPLVLVRHARQGCQVMFLSTLLSSAHLFWCGMPVKNGRLCFFPHSSHQPTCSGAACSSRMAGYVFSALFSSLPLALVRYARQEWQVMFFPHSSHHSHMPLLWRPQSCFHLLDFVGSVFIPQTLPVLHNDVLLQQNLARSATESGTLGSSTTHSSGLPNFSLSNNAFLNSFGCPCSSVFLSLHLACRLYLT